MELSAYCLSYGNWTVIPSHWDRVFADMKEIGFDAVDLSFSESEMMYSMRTFEQQIAAAHRNGLKVYVIPSRFGGRFAGAPYMPSYWLTQHPEYALPRNPMLGCLESEEFVGWCSDRMRDIVRNFAVDGVIWDEIKGIQEISTHPDTLKKYGPNPTAADMIGSSLNFLRNMTNVVLSVRPDLTITVFNMPWVPEEFTIKAAGIIGVKYAGFDGPCSPQSFFHEIPNTSKPWIRQSWNRTLRECAVAGCGTFALLENILIPDSAISAYEEELALVLKEVTPDHLSCYYYGHNNESAEYIQKITMQQIAALKRC